MNDISVEIYKLQQAQETRRENAKLLKEEIDNIEEENRELTKLLENPGEYSPKALRRNIKRNLRNIAQIEAVIKTDRAGVRQLAHMIGVLEQRRNDNQD